MNARVLPEPLEEFTAQLLETAGAPAPKARLAAQVILAANLRGFDSHGVQLLPHYIAQFEAGDVDPRAEGCMVMKSGACARFDAQNGMGMVTAAACSAEAVRLASEFGLGMVTAFNANHFGITGFWTQRISSAGHIGIAMCDASRQVPPWQGRERLLGTNPISVSVPSPGGRGWLLDMATSTIALGKLEQARLEGKETLPAGWALDSEGRPTTSLAAALNGFLMPLGGYKGTGLALMVEILCGVLSGGALPPEVRGIREHGRPARVNHAFLAIDVSRFMPLDIFQQRVEQLIAEVRAVPPAAGFSEVLVAGDPEWRAEDQRRRDGIPIAPAVWAQLEQLSEKLKVPLPPR